MSPVRAFFLLGAVATIVPLTVFATRPEASPSPGVSPTRSPDFALSEAEAIHEFEDLRDQAMDAIRHRDLSLIDETFTPNGPARARAVREIHRLLKADVVDESRFESRSIEVISNDSEEIKILERGRLQACFRAASGEDVSEGPAAVFQVAVWTMRVVGPEWRIYDAQIRSDRSTRGRASCD